MFYRPSALVAHVLLTCVIVSVAAGAASPNAGEMAAVQQWAAKTTLATQDTAHEPGLSILSNHDPVQKNGRFGKPLHIGGQAYTRGLYCHANSEILVRLPGPGAAFEAMVGIDNNENTAGGNGSVVFSVHIGDKEAFRSGVLQGKQDPVPVRVALENATEFRLCIGDGGDGISCDQSDWADAKVTLADGSICWIDELPTPQNSVISEPGELPFHFLYDGKPSTTLLAQWPVQRTAEPIDANRTRFSVTYTDPASALEVRCQGIQYHDFPIIEWTLYFKNNGTADTKILEQINPLDIRMTRGDTKEFLLHHFVGSPCQPNDYQPLETTLEPNASKKFSGEGGRATSRDMCYFNVESKTGDGLIVGLGWPGQWAANFTRDGGKTLRIQAGQETTHFKLLPGEEVRTPLVVLQFWQDDWVRSQNVWRRWMIAHNLPRPGGNALKPFVTADSSAQFGEMIGANEENQKYFIDRYREEKLAIEYWWMDAGWYPCDGSWPKTGTWEVDKTRFPNGLRAITDHAHQNGLKIIVWFEPERVAGGTWISQNHPDWVLGDKNNGLLYLGNDEARNWLIDRVDTLIKEQGIDLYRQDFNYGASLDNWLANDAPDRQGISEIKHVTGYLDYWDSLIRRRNGNLLIDTCASGGRRNDLETLRRAVPLWRTDFPFNPTATQCHTYGISFWIPLSGTGVKVIDDYDFRSNAAPEFTCHWDVRDKSLDYDLIRKQLKDWRAYADNFMGDYYPLTPYSLTEDTWMAWQFDRPESGQGMVQIFRRSECIYTAAKLPLRGLDASAHYRVTNLDTEISDTVSGKELLEQGLAITMPEPRRASVLLYQKL